MNQTLIKGKYRIIREIARSNDIVYEAQDEAFGRKIALKELNLVQGLTGQARRERIERFEREAKAAGRLSHPHIVSIFDYGEEDGRYFIAMEFLEGQTLRDKIVARGALSIPDALEIAHQVLDALGYAHQRGVIHRDIKPDNIHILPGGQAKLTDFGIARISDQPQLTSNGQIFGTPSFMSPEQIAGGAIDARTDLFSLGIVLYEMLAGRRPFVGDSVVSITYAIMNAEPPPIAGLPYGLEQVLRRALAKSPLHRYSSATEFQQALKTADQTPALFLNNQQSLHSGMTGNFGAMPQQQGYPLQQSPYPQQQQIPPMMQGYPPPPTVVHGYPQQMPIPQIPPTMQPPVPQDGAPFGWNGQAPQSQTGQPQRPRKPRRTEPLIVLSPGAKSAINAVLAAVVLGTAIAFGVIWFQKAYQVNQGKASNAKIVVLINQGAEAYNKRDYVKAADLFGQAWKAKPQGKEYQTVQFNLAASCIQLAQAAENTGRWNDAESWYRRALDVDTANKTALNGLANVLERLGKTVDARQMREAAVNGRDLDVPSDYRGDTSAPHLESSHLNPSNALPPPPDNRDKEVAQLLQDGLQLEQAGNLQGAKDKYDAALEKSPGTNFRPQILERLNNVKAMLSGGSNSSDSGG